MSVHEEINDIKNILTDRIFAIAEKDKASNTTAFFINEQEKSVKLKKGSVLVAESNEGFLSKIFRKPHSPRSNRKIFERESVRENSVRSGTKNTTKEYHKLISHKEDNLAENKEKRLSAKQESVITPDNHPLDKLVGLESLRHLHFKRKFIRPISTCCSN